MIIQIIIIMENSLPQEYLQLLLASEPKANRNCLAHLIIKLVWSQLSDLAIQTIEQLIQFN